MYHDETQIKYKLIINLVNISTGTGHTYNKNCTELYNTEFHLWIVLESKVVGCNKE